MGDYGRQLKELEQDFERQSVENAKLRIKIVQLEKKCRDYDELAKMLKKMVERRQV